jgi:2-(3-amino-3-carboxypropyl)histidine synthase
MEDDRAQVDLGVAADIEEREEEAAALRQPKKRFVGRRQAEEAASRNNANGSIESSGAVKGQIMKLPLNV